MRILKYCKRCDLVYFTNATYCPLCLNSNSRPFVMLTIVTEKDIKDRYLLPTRK